MSVDPTQNVNVLSAHSRGSSVRGTSPLISDMAASRGDDFWGDDGFTFSDILDLINPLQHIPVVSTFYHEITGDTISPGARIIGGGLFGGVMGVMAEAFNSMVEEATGKDIGGLVMAKVRDIGGGGEDVPAAVVASVAPPSGALSKVDVLGASFVPAASTDATDPGALPVSRSAPQAIDAGQLSLILADARAADSRDRRDPRGIAVNQALHAMSRALDRYEAMSRLGVSPEAEPSGIDESF